MTKLSPQLADRGALLAINLLFLIIWACTAIPKVKTGVPPWFGDKFGQTFLATFPGLTLTFWLLTISEVVALVLSVVSLARFEFLRLRPDWLSLMLVWSLFVFTQLSLGQWVTADYNATPQLFAYFAGTLVSLLYVKSTRPA